MSGPGIKGPLWGFKGVRSPPHTLSFFLDVQVHSHGLCWSVQGESFPFSFFFSWITDENANNIFVTGCLKNDSVRYAKCKRGI